MECLMKRIIPILALVTGLLAALPSAWSYEEIVVSNGGTVTGQVFLKGTKPDPKAYNLALYPEPAFCGRISTGTGWRLLDQFPLAPDGGLQNIVENPHYDLHVLGLLGESVEIQPTHEVQQP